MSTGVFFLLGEGFDYLLIVLLGVVAVFAAVYTLDGGLTSFIASFSNGFFYSPPVPVIDGLLLLAELVYPVPLVLAVVPCFLYLSSVDFPVV